MSMGFNRLGYRLLSLIKSDKNPKVSFKAKPEKASGPKKAKEAVKQEKVDMILDKISQSGYDSLSKEEKEFLFSASNDDK